jgi:hypothetical protein
LSGRLAISERQVRALCKGAKEAGYAPVIKIGETLVWLVPEDKALAGVKPPATVDDEEVVEL